MANVWKVIEKLAQGGVGEVYLARSPEGETVAVKVLSATSPEARTLFEQQVRILARLRHPAIVSVQGYLLKSDAIFGDDRGPCYWMEYVEGEDLTKASSKQKTGQILNWFREALEALKFVHSQGVVHGDLSPKNILIDSERKIRILDFSVLPGSGHTSDVATLPYMAPERIDGRLLPASDLFSLGTIFYESLAGLHPRAGCRTVQELIRFEPRPLVEACPEMAGEPLAARVIDRMIRADLAERLSDAGKVLEVLHQGKWEEGSGDSADFYPVRMLGADGCFAAVEEALEKSATHSAVFGIHGISGVGKSRFLREIGFEAAMKGVEIRIFENLHQATLESRASLLSFLRALPPKGSFVLLEWNDDGLNEDARRFLGQLVSSGLVRELRLENLVFEETRTLLKGPLDAPAVEEAVDLIYQRTQGNPRRILETLRDLSSGKKIRRRSLAPGWKDVLREFSSPLEILQTRLKDVSPEGLREGALTVAGELWKEGKKTESIEVIDYSTQAIGDDAAVSRLLRMKANILNEMGRFEEANACLDQWFPLKASDEPLPLKTAKYWLVTGLNHQNLGRMDEAERRLRRCLKEAEATPKDESLIPYRIRAYSTLGLQERKRGHLGAARDLFKKGLDLAGPRGWRRAEILRNMAVVLSQEGDWKGAKSLLDEAQSLYREENHSEGEFSTFLQEGNLALENDDPVAAETAYRRAEETARTMQSDLNLAMAWNNRGLLERQQGRLQQALDHLRRAWDIFRFLGNANDIRENLHHLAIAEASAGLFERAFALVREIGESDMGTERIVRDLKDGVVSVAEESPLARDLVREHWNRERVLRQLIHEGDSPDVLRELLMAIFEKLPPELQVSFAGRGDYQRWVMETQEPPIKKNREGPEEKGAGGDFLKSLKSINREILREDNMTRVLRGLMDSAIRLSGAENGFLVLKCGAEESSAGPLPGYEVVVERNMDHKEIVSGADGFSLSAVRHALQSGETLVTDNALLDPVFKNSKSVHARKLKSILALPIHGTEGVLGVFYLDHRFQDGLFEGDVLEVMEVFSGVAALALQKGRMIEALAKSNLDLSERVRTQTREINRSRLALKNEYGDIIGRSPRMVEVLSMVDAITDAKVSVWIYGESGTGKEAIARALHFNSGRAKKPFVSENCSALPESLLESELFGHKKGAFTHATADKKGILQYADGGTIFLDEIADMSLGLQAKLLRFLQEGEIRPIGSQEIVRVDVRVVSASNKDLETLVSEAKFREDLFYRLNGVTVRLPPLRERMEDLPLLVEHFLKKIGTREKKEPCRVDPQVLRIFLNYAWPGNIRELQNTLETAVLFAPEGIITLASLQFKPALFGKTKIATPTVAKPQQPEMALDPVLEKTLLAIRDNCYHKGMAAKALGIARRTLYERLRRFGVGTDLPALKARIEERFG